MARKILWAALPHIPRKVGHNDWTADFGQWRAFLRQAPPGEDKYFWTVRRLDGTDEQCSDDNPLPYEAAKKYVEDLLQKLTKPGRRAIGERAMTAAERQATRMARLRGIEAAAVVAVEAERSLREAREEVISGQASDPMMLEKQKKAHRAWVALETALEEGRRKREALQRSED